MSVTWPIQPADSTDPYNRQDQIFPILTEEQIQRAKSFGELQTLAQHTVLFERGDRSVDFFIVLEGNIEIYEYTSQRKRVITVHRKHQFTGELDLFNDREILVGRGYTWC